MGQIGRSLLLKDREFIMLIFMLLCAMMHLYNSYMNKIIMVRVRLHGVTGEEDFISESKYGLDFYYEALSIATMKLNVKLPGY